ncbi:hypothetical protein [uncultured Tenacibaculum sp.]|uniref:hypothetical protein n=1 Tax=uncultured Tenacibaculum sp. TaxID=174713 RepID=UPI002632A7B8|nr:hypothetical protein [uncultured Tenacibaculum sp.]
MKLTDTQIQDLYTFTSQNDVRYYDIQIELVDHLANDIEAIMTENPTIDFEHAKYLAFQKFGQNGFSKFETNRVFSLIKKNYKIVSDIIRDWFSFPKIILIFIAALVIFELQKVSYSNYFILAIVNILMTIKMITILKLGKKMFINRKDKITKRWTLDEIKEIYSIHPFVILFFFSKFLLREDNSFIYFRNLQQIALSLTVVLFLVFSYIDLIIIPKRTKELLQKTYAEY